MDAIVSVRGLSKAYGPTRVLHDLSLTIGPGVTGLLGPNGAGKSTFIKALLGLVRVNAGEGEVLGLRLGRDAREIRARTGFMPEDDCHLPGLTGIEALSFSARLWGMERREALRRAHEILDFTGFAEERYRPVDQYSTGMRKRLNFAQALVHDPDFLILDEPTSGLDPEQRPGMLDRIRTLAERHGKAVLLCTHILSDVQAVCDGVVILTRGRVRLQERLEVLQRPVTPTLTLHLHSGIEALADRLRSEGFGVAVPGSATLRVDGPAAELSERIWGAVRATGAVLGGLEPARNSLEAIFLDAVREGDATRDHTGEGLDARP